MALTGDPDFRATTFIIVDFETTTPTGRPAQPIEVAALALRLHNGTWQERGRSTSLIRPPAFAPVTPADTAQTGLTADQLANAPTPAQALGALDRRLTPGTPYLLVAQHAATEANILHHQAEHCPTLARTNLIDTIPLAKHLVPGLPNYKLDTLLAHFTIPQPPNRHRAPDDVDVTTKIFLHLIAAADLDPRLNSLTALLKTAGRTAKANQPVQAGLFDT